MCVFRPVLTLLLNLKILHSKVTMFRCRLCLAEVDSTLTFRPAESSAGRQNRPSRRCSDSDGIRSPPASKVWLIKHSICQVDKKKTCVQQKLDLWETVQKSLKAVFCQKGHYADHHLYEIGVVSTGTCDQDGILSGNIWFSWSNTF